jgi:hypothetical protein
MNQRPVSGFLRWKRCPVITVRSSSSQLWREDREAHPTALQGGLAVVFCSAAFNWHCFTRLIRPRICDRFACLENCKSFNQEWLKSYTCRIYLLLYPFSCQFLSSTQLSADFTTRWSHATPLHFPFAVLLGVPRDSQNKHWLFQI